MTIIPRFVLIAGFALGVFWIVWGFLGAPVVLPDVPNARFQCLSYTPFRGEQTPFDEDLIIPREQIREDMDKLAPVTGCVRTYSARMGLDAVVPLAHERGMKVLVGTWIGRENKGNQREVQATLAAAATHPEAVRAIIVGNEVLLRREQDAAGLIRIIEQVRGQTSLPITYADVWEFWLQNPSVAEHVDFLTIHILPYWEDEPVAVEQALRHVAEILALMRATFPGKEILIGETGWPSRGRTREEAAPGVVNQARFIREFIALTQREGMSYNLIEAFDQPWKRFQEGTVGGHWGLFDGDRRIKFPLVGSVSEHPGWFWLVGVGGVVSVFVLLAAVRGGVIGWWRWLLLAGLGHVGVLLLYFQARMVGHAAIDLKDWVLGGVGVGVMVVALVLLGVVVAAPGSRWGRVMPADLVLVRDWLVRRIGVGLELPELVWGVVRAVTLLTATVLTLALVVDGRYLDFPLAMMLVPALLLVGRTEVRRCPMEAWLAVLMLVGVVVLIPQERPWNLEAMAWCGELLLLVWPLRGALAREWREVSS